MNMSISSDKKIHITLKYCNESLSKTITYEKIHQFSENEVHFEHVHVKKHRKNDTLYSKIPPHQ